MKLIHKYSRFNFEDETGNKYDAICEAAKLGENIFRIYKNGNLLGKYQPNGGHANKTQAKEFIKRVVEKQIKTIVL